MNIYAIKKLKYYNSHRDCRPFSMKFDYQLNELEEKVTKIFENMSKIMSHREKNKFSKALLIVLLFQNKNSIWNKSVAQILFFVPNFKNNAMKLCLNSLIAYQFTKFKKSARFINY